MKKKKSIYLGGRHTEGDRVVSPILLMPSTAGTGSSGSQEAEIPSGSRSWVAETQRLGPYSTAFPDGMSRELDWIRCGAAGTGTSASIWHFGITSYGLGPVTLFKYFNGAVYFSLVLGWDCA